MKQGTVKFFKQDKGYGFIECDGKDYFVHVSGCKDEIEKDNVVEFEIEEGEKGLKAVNVQVIGQ